MLEMVVGIILGILILGAWTYIGYIIGKVIQKYLNGK